jgi:hypothetical protein
MQAPKWSIVSTRSYQWPSSAIGGCDQVVHGHVLMCGLCMFQFLNLFYFVVFGVEIFLVSFNSKDLWWLGFLKEKPVISRVTSEFGMQARRSWQDHSWLPSWLGCDDSRWHPKDVSPPPSGAPPQQPAHNSSYSARSTVARASSVQ